MLTRLFLSLALVLGLCLNLPAQLGGPCPVGNSTNQSIALSRDVVCTLPQVYGPGGLVGTPNNGPLASTEPFSHAAHFENASVERLGSLNSEIGTQISQLPLTAPAVGFVFSFNASLGVISRQIQNFGPILSDRAQTIGRHKLFVGASYQYFNFDKIDGIDLRHFGTVYPHERNGAAAVCTAQPTYTGCSTLGYPFIINDFITTTLGVGLTINQVTATADLGLTNRFDVAVAVPILMVHMNVYSDAVVHSFESPTTIPQCCVHVFVTPGVVPGETAYAPNHASFLRNNTSSGLGDVVVRAKYEVFKGERAGLAAGVDVHTPTGDPYNFLGSGAWGTRPFLTFSYKGRVAPHANLGYQINGNSILGGDVTTFTMGHLPNILNYAVGADAGLVRRVSVSFDYLGQTLIDESAALATTFTAPTPCDVCAHPLSTAPNISSIRENINQSSISLGGKFNPFSRLLVTMNALIRVNDGGLHYKPAPMLGVSYTF